MRLEKLGIERALSLWWFSELGEEAVWQLGSYMCCVLFQTLDVYENNCIFLFNQNVGFKKESVVAFETRDDFILYKIALYFAVLLSADIAVKGT